MGTPDLQTEELIAKIEELLPRDAGYADTYGLFFLAYKMNGQPMEECRRPQEWLAKIAVSRKLWEYLTNLLDSIDVSALYRCSQETPQDVLKEYLLQPIHIYHANPRTCFTASAPMLINELALGILEIEPDETVAEIHCGDSTFLARAAQSVPNASYLGIDPNEKHIFCSLMRADVTESSISMSNTSIIEWFANLKDASVDKILLNYPLGQTALNIEADTELLEEMASGLPALHKATSADWVLNKLCIDTLSERGRAVSYSVASSTQGKRDIDFRKTFVENGWIEAVIALPKKTFYPFTGVDTALFVLSKNNKGVRLVDATDLNRDDTWSELLLEFESYSPKVAEQILKRLQSDSERSRFLSLGEIRENGYRLAL